MKNVRLVHFYVGVFFAPLIIFFAFTGVLQVFKLHETYREIPNSQGNWIAWFGQFHKEQAWIPPKVAPAKAAPKKPHEEGVYAKPMKWLVALMGIALMGSALAGLYIAFSYPGRRKPCLVALAAGIVIPLALMAF
jgi:uncharacterized iron-regulated membrane protein